MSPLTEPTRLTLAKSFTWNESVWNPSMIQTALWLDAADASTITTVSGAVSQWNDKSGNGRNASQATAAARPALTTSALNNRNVLTFSPATTADFLQCSTSPISGTGSFTLLTVAKTASTSFSYLCGQGGSNAGDPGLGIATTSGGYYGFIQDSTRQILTTIGSSSADGNYKIRSDLFNRSSNWELYINGSSVGSESISARSGTLTGSTPFYVGVYSNASSGFWDGQVCEIIIIPTATSAGIRQKLEGYLAHKWGLTANLPAGHPYKTVAPTP